MFLRPSKANLSLVLGRTSIGHNRSFKDRSRTTEERLKTRLKSSSVLLGYTEHEHSIMFALNIYYDNYKHNTMLKENIIR
jgi:hypothetical protein